MNQITTRTRFASLAAAVAVNAALIATAFAAFPSTEPMAVATLPVVEITAVRVSAVTGERAVN